jgi:hypothetical protein
MSIMDKLKTFVGKNPEKVERGVNKVAEVADKRTGGKYGGKINTARDKAKEAIKTGGRGGRSGGQRGDQGGQG